jgi:SH3 domain protein
LGGLCLACAVSAETLYVVDHVQVSVNSQPTLDGETVGVIRTGDTVELIGREAEAAQVRLADGTEGWVKGTYLSEQEPAAARVEALSAENERLKAAARSATGGTSDLKAAQATNAELKSALDQARAEVTRLREAARSAPAQASDELQPQMSRRDSPDTPWRLILTILAIGAALGLGFWWGYRTLERRVLAKYGGLKVY